MANIFRAVIMGPPGSGKGTISSRIGHYFKISCVGCGDILRDHIAKNTTQGKQAKAYIEKGELVPDELVTNLILEILEACSRQHWLLDGFPRTVKQAESLAAKFRISSAINLVVPDEIIVSRLKGRWLHAASGRVYNLDFNPPKIPGKDDITGDDLVQRDDDKPDIVMSRLNNYRKTYSPVLEYYRQKHILKEFKGRETNEIWPRVKLYLEDIIGK